MNKFEYGQITLRNEDCLEYLKKLPDKHFKLAIVDPPYGINVNHNIGRRKNIKKSSYAKVDWDTEAPSLEYFNELFRVSNNQVIWGANHFIDKIPIASSCWLIWDKLFSNKVSFASAELAWTSFNSTVKRFALSSRDKNRIHPTQKPVELYEWILNNYAKKGDCILDTHLGSASSAIAAYNLGFKFTGIEINKEYYKAAVARFSNCTRYDYNFND